MTAFSRTLYIKYVFLIETLKNALSKTTWIILPFVLFFVVSCASTQQQKTESKDAGFYNDRGIAFAQKGQQDQAISDYNKALEINPRHAKSYYNRGNAYYYQKEYDKSWDDIKKVQDLGYQVPPKFLDDLRKASGRAK